MPGNYFYELLLRIYFPIIIKKYEFSSYSLLLEMAEKWDFMKKDARICPKRLKQSRLLILATSLASLVVMCQYKQRTAIP